jgi:hypothetical protein
VGELSLRARTDVQASRVCASGEDEEEPINQCQHAVMILRLECGIGKVYERGRTSCPAYSMTFGSRPLPFDTLDLELASEVGPFDVRITGNHPQCLVCCCWTDV